MSALDKELETYSLKEAEFKQHHLGQFVLIKGDTVVGFFNTINEALTEGTRLYGLDSYLVRRIGAPVTKINIPALSLGLLRANY
jgi:hypothetical protein